ncbi:hypothetical protein DSM106972_030390 [Dulcicalothrix desertica PCC 7102]|uniref:Uncharacterized protein n=1 Tax=Dulcicalothrix desertica PCC 7102 TaxID=232991 RepID=A0A433VL78_9CYAN|nr:hypothetical protein [Dulcicalothrix desertica]RUT06782.1 hypothetical protein DSM106972_030390 [Dulcicalothrix desertica PCC 7102]TWH50109.1 hypothetical protein CAL7102_04393 [Dulcicalothrix desertica PCC 7102]
MERQGFHSPKPQSAICISEEHLEAMLLEGLNSGTPTEMTS